MAQSNAINANTTGIVGNTGTSFTGTPLTQYLVNCGGATSSTISQVASTGTSGQILTSNGSGALPSFQDASSSGFTSINVQTFTSNGTYTPISGMKYCIVEVQGAGGGGGGAATTVSGEVSAAGGGGAGAYAKGVIDAATIGASQSVTIGAAGAAGAAGNNVGGTGGTTSLGSLISCTGGVGGTGCPSTIGFSSAGGAGGTASGSGVSFSITGSRGLSSSCLNNAATPFNNFYLSGQGANSYFGPGGASRNSTTGPGAGSAGSLGSGGSGGATSASGQQAGGAGGAGYIVITEFI